MKQLISLTSIILMLMLLGASQSAFAGKIYKWVDSEGKIHYGERPPAGNGQQMRVPRNPPRGATPAPSATTGENKDAASKFLESVAAERKEKNEAADKAAKNKEIADKNCSRARKNVATLKQGGRRYEMDEKGERKYMSEEDIQKRLKESEAMVKEWCK